MMYDKLHKTYCSNQNQERNIISKLDFPPVFIIDAFFFWIGKEKGNLAKWNCIFLLKPSYIVSGQLINNMMERRVADPGWYRAGRGWYRTDLGWYRADPGWYWADPGWYWADSGCYWADLGWYWADPSWYWPGSDMIPGKKSDPNPDMILQKT